jgi:uncharacterized protein
MFGSSIGGNWDQYSDIDIIVVYPTSKTFNQRLKELYMRWDIPRAVDILAYTPEEFDQLMQERFFVQDSVRHGQVIYEREQAGS